MIRYTVAWAKVAEDELAELWNESSQKSRIALAADQIDRELATDAHDRGEQLSDGLRLISISVLAAYFTVEPEDCMVRVWAIRLNHGQS